MKASTSGFTLRDAHPADKAEVLTFTANTWEGGDYIQWVFDDWVRDTSGRFLVAVDEASGKLAAIDKLSFFSDTEAWFEGLRVNPEFRGRGLASFLEKFMLEEARGRGAKTVRFLTTVNNTPVHRNAFRNGFSMRFIVRHWKWFPPGEAGKRTPPEPMKPLQLRAATVEEAPKLYDWWRRTSSCNMTDGLLHRTWSFSDTSADEWARRASKNQLLIPERTAVDEAALPPPMALIASGRTQPSGPTWTISALSATGSEWVSLAEGLVVRALDSGITEISGLLPDSGQLYSAFKAAGFEPDGDEECLTLFELRLDQGLSANSDKLVNQA